MSEQVSCADVPDLLSETADVIVVGAGPAGSSVASHLAKAGLDVLLLEKTRFPREKACGDGLTPRAVRALTVMGVPIAERDGWPRGAAGIVASLVGVNDNAAPLMLALHRGPPAESAGRLSRRRCATPAGTWPTIPSGRRRAGRSSPSEPGGR